MTAEAARKLRAPFPPESIGRLPKGGVMLDYCGHAATTDRLLSVDPSWTWEPLALDEVGLPAIDAAGNLWIRLTVCGVTRIGVGDGKNMKERIGDALRNAAMRFGVALDLWSKEELEGSHESKAPAHPVQTTPLSVEHAKRALWEAAANVTSAAGDDRKAYIRAALQARGISDTDIRGMSELAEEWTNV